MFSRVREGEAKGLGRRRTRSGKNVRGRKKRASISTHVWIHEHERALEYSKKAASYGKEFSYLTLVLI